MGTLWGWGIPGVVTFRSLSVPQSEGPYDVILPRASTSPMPGSASSTLRAEDAFAAQARHSSIPRDTRSCQVGEWWLQQGQNPALPW